MITLKVRTTDGGIEKWLVGGPAINPMVNVELNEKGEWIGVEILEASRFVRDTVLECAQGRMLQLPVSRPSTE